MYVVVVLCVLCVRACGHLTHCTHVWCCVCVCVRAQGYARHKLHEMGFARTPQMDRLLEQYPNDLETVVTALASSERGGGRGDAPCPNHRPALDVLAPLAGGYRKGDRVASLIDYNTISKGDVGTVVGPCSDDGAATKAERVCVDFGDGKGRANYKATSQLEHAPLAGGYRKGDRVASLIDFNTISKGDVGTVLGPCEDKNGVARVRVDFGDGKWHAKCDVKLIDHVPSFPPTALASPTTEAGEAPVAARRVSKRWGDGLEAPAAGSRNFLPQGFEVTLDVSESIACFGHSASHVLQIMDAGNAKASTSPTPLAPVLAAALYAYTEEVPPHLYRVLNDTMRTPDTPSTPTDAELERYGAYIVHTENALSSLPTHVSQLHGKVYRGIKALLSPDVYAPGKRITWQAFSSSTKKQIATSDFVNKLPGRKLQGSLFIIDSITAKDIRHFSAFPSEEEVLFPPNSQFTVEQVVTREEEKKALLSQLGAYDMTDLDVYVLNQTA